MDVKYYTLPDVEKIVDRSYKTINRWINQGIFPPPVKIHQLGQSGSIFWIKTDLDDWFKSKRPMRFL